MQGPFSRKTDRTCLITDANGDTVVAVAKEMDAQVVCDALNNYLHNNTRRNDPRTSRDAERSMSLEKLRGHTKTAIELYLKFGPMSDEQLYEKFQELQTKITQDRVEHIRLTLQRSLLVVHRKDLTAKTSTGRSCRVFSLPPSSSQAHD